MGLENLKSAFSNIGSQNQSDLTEMSSRYSSTPESPKTDSSVFIHHPNVGFTQATMETGEGV